MLHGSNVDVHLLDVSLKGASLTVEAPSVTVAAGSVVSTILDDANAGPITFQNATEIHLGSGATLNAGDQAILLSVADVPAVGDFGLQTSAAKITLDEADVVDGNVEFEARAEAAASFGADGILGGFTLDTDSFFQNLSVIGGVSQSVADASIEVSGGSITADSLTMQADATADSKVLVFTAIVGIGFRHILVSHCHQVFRIQLTSFLAWYNEHRPHMRLGGRAPNEVYFRRHLANRRPRIEPRTHCLRRSRCARPQTLVARQPGDRFTLQVGHLNRQQNLPIVTLRRVA